VLLADSGLGKTVLGNALCASTTDFLVVGVAGAEPETSLPMAGLHRVLQPLTGYLPDLPPHQAEVLAQIADAQAEPADQLLLFSSVHRLLTDVARRQPLLCWVDDAQWLDQDSLDALAFVARRLEGTRVAMVFAGPHEGGIAGDRLAGLPRLELGPLDDEAARHVLDDSVPDGIPADLAADLVDLASGNPLALVELASSLTSEQLCGEAPAPATLPPHSRQRRTILRRLGGLSADARRLVMMAVVDEQFDVDTVLRAATEAGIELPALDEATASGLVRVDGESVAVQTELTRAVLRAEASLSERHDAHRLLTGLLDEKKDRLRWVWHRASAAGAPTEQYATELGDAAKLARRSGDYVASSTAYQRAASLTNVHEVKSRRLLEAARDAWLGSGTRRARALIRQVGPLADTPRLAGFADLLHGAIELQDGLPAMAAQSLLTAADGLSGTDRTRAVLALVLAGEASCVVGDYAGYSAIAAQAAAMRQAEESPFAELVFEHFAGMAATYEARHQAAMRPLRRVVQLGTQSDHVLSKILASQAAYTLGDVRLAYELASHAVNTARNKGIHVLLPWALVYVAISAVLLDQHSAAVAGALEGLREAQALGQLNCVVDHRTILALLASMQGDRETALLNLDATTEIAAARGLGRPSTLSSWAMACVDLADDKPGDAMDRLRLMAAGTGKAHLAIRVMAAPTVVEAAVRSHRPRSGTHALTTFDRWIGNSGCAPRLALSHRCHALLSEREDDADEHFREAIRLHRSSDTALELAKTELFYAYQLRRGRKPMAARELLRDAVKIFHNYDAETWADRATAELRAAGESVQAADTRTPGDLTAQQQQISRLVADGATNREIAAQLFLSHRTIDHHLRNIFAKLGVRSRVELSSLFR
jgi:DNA-binding CsgD family transcriptional regulator